MTLELKTSNLIKISAICSFLGALTTGLLIFLPNPVATDFESQALLHNNNLYITKLWMLFFHPQFNFIASIGIAVLLFKKHPFKISLGLLFLFIWAYTEMTQQALLIDGLNQFWRPGYLNADSEVQKNIFRTLIEGTSALSDSKYFIVIYGFGLGTLLYGIAMMKELYLAKYIGYSLLFIGFLSLSAFCTYYLNMFFFNGFRSFSYNYIYPYLQPIVRIAIGVWLLKNLNSQIK